MLCSNGLIQSVLQSELSNHMIRDSEFQMCSLLLSWHVLVARLEISNRLLRWWWVWGQETLNILTRPTQIRDWRHLLPETQHQREYVHPCVSISLHNMIQDWFREGSKYSQNFKDFSPKQLFLIDFEPSLTFNVPGQGLSNWEVYLI